MPRNSYPPKTSPEWETLAAKDLKVIGKRVRDTREEAGVSQTRLAGLMDIAVNTLRGMESGTSAVSISTLKLVAMHLETDARELLGGPINETDTSIT